MNKKRVDLKWRPTFSSHSVVVNKKKWRDWNYKMKLKKTLKVSVLGFKLHMFE